mmetsp:Transcript_14879/g.43695  ORF Transcript_14879/g.43695 Transcript_14879/m.43695 type:complete len:203 (+) Transcript_14879:2683-3291(+)
MSAITLRDHPGSTIVTDSVTSNGLTKFITDLGGKHLRFKRGYKNVIGKGIELNKQGVDCHLMMETSGHGAVKDNWFLDDGAFLAVQVVIEMVRRREAGLGGIGDLLAKLPEAKEAAEVCACIPARHSCACLRACAWACTRTGMCIGMRVGMHAYRHVCVRACMCTGMHAYGRACIGHACVRACMRTGMRAGMLACMCMLART